MPGMVPAVQRVVVVVGSPDWEGRAALERAVRGADVVVTGSGGGASALALEAARGEGAEAEVLWGETAIARAAGVGRVAAMHAALGHDVFCHAFYSAHDEQEADEAASWLMLAGFRVQVHEPPALSPDARERLEERIRAHFGPRAGETVAVEDGVAVVRDAEGRLAALIPASELEAE